MTRFVAFAVVAFSLLGAGCINPLSMRRAQTLRPGEVEVIVAPEIAGFNGDAGALIGQPNLAAGGTAFPSVTASLRFGVIDKLDLQLVVDPSIIPEINLGYQLIGEKPGDLTLTLTGGVKPVIGVGGAVVFGWLHFPVGVLIDIPFNDSSALYTGLTVPVSTIFGAGGGGGGGVFLTEPTVHAGLSLKFGTLVLQPEISVAQTIYLFDSAGALASGSLPLLQYAVGFGIGGRFGGAAAPSAPTE